ncbi:DM13 domain-containing protein [Marinobacterium jannaschii]|uniref:DM13 domain-containing protein n=1 Tax=Marinobacterium jannaschii TaxID=64970 RepID=UPI00048761FF|nr:DM13 domain-containing protein [Marinobacterium jannaschii]
MKKLLLLTLSHLAIAFAGFSAGIYLLPVITATESPASAVMQAVAAKAEYEGVFKRDLQDSDFLHWGEGKLSVAADAIVFQGELAPGPDYKLYLSPEFVETEADFNRLKDQMVRIGDIDSFDGFLLSLPEGLNPARYSTAIIWCETFGQFISAAQYR